MTLTIFFITWPQITQIQVCLALYNSEFHELFKNADGFNHKHIIDNEKHKTNLETFFLGHPVYKMHCKAPLVAKKQTNRTNKGCPKQTYVYCAVLINDNIKTLGILKYILCF